MEGMVDNADHYVRTIDGLNTVHGMRLIVIMVIVTTMKKVARDIPRISVSAEDIVAEGQINIKHLSSP